MLKYVDFEDCWTALKTHDYDRMERLLTDEFNDGQEDFQHAVNVDWIKPRYAGRRCEGYDVHLQVYQRNLVDNDVIGWEEDHFIPRT